MNVLVTGGAGFIGSAVVRHLLRDTDAVIIDVDKLTYAGNLDSLAEVADHPRHRFVQADICDAAEMASVFAEHHPPGGNGSWMAGIVASGWAWA